jgi:hypothetical protein
MNVDNLLEDSQAGLISKAITEFSALSIQRR